MQPVAVAPSTLDTPRLHTAANSYKRNTFRSPRAAGSDTDAFSLSNTTMERNLSSGALLRAAGGLKSQPSRRKDSHDNRATPRLNSMRQELDRVDSSINAVLENHVAFVQKQELLSPSRKRASAFMPALANTARNSVMPTPKAKSAATQKPQQQLPEDDPDEEDVPWSPTAATKLSRSQKKAMMMFKQIDNGKVDKDRVFASIGTPLQRVETRLDFFRDRSEGHILNIEERFMVHDKQLGMQIVDLEKLMLPRSAREPRATSHREILPPIDTEELANPLISQDSTSSWFESAAQRSLRLTTLGHERDQRITSTRATARRSDLDRRSVQLEQLEAKAARKETADRHRLLMTWLAVAGSFHIMSRDLRRHLGDPGERQRLMLRARARKLWEKARLMVMEKVSEQLTAVMKQSLARRHEQFLTFPLWKKALLPMLFMGKLREARKRRHCIELVKVFIEAAWKGMQFKKNMRAFLNNIRFLQRAARAALKFRSGTRQFVYHPYLWEVETQILSEKLGDTLPHGMTKKKITSHRNHWNLEMRLQELRNISTQRVGFHFGNPDGPRGRRRAQEPLGRRGAGRKGHRMALRSDVWHAAIFSEIGEAVQPNFDAKTEPQWILAATQMLDKFRLDVEDRQRILRVMLRGNVEKWWQAHLEYKQRKTQFSTAWQQWRVEVQALGPAARDAWPPMPAIPRMATLMLDTDVAKLRSMVVDRLSQTEMGQQLFTRLR